MSKLEQKIFLFVAAAVFTSLAHAEKIYCVNEAHSVVKYTLELSQSQAQIRFAKVISARQIEKDLSAKVLNLDLNLEYSNQGYRQYDSQTAIAVGSKYLRSVHVRVAEIELEKQADIHMTLSPSDRYWPGLGPLQSSSFGMVCKRL